MLRAFFETELCGAFTWDDTQGMPGEPAPRGKYNRRNPLGPCREISAVHFSDYDLAIASPEECGPLGEVVLRYDSVIEKGPIDQVTWKRLGKIICERELAKVNGYGERKPEYAG